MESENKGYTSSGPTKNGARWQLAVSDWLRINMEMEGWEKWGLCADRLMCLEAGIQGSGCGLWISVLSQHNIIGDGNVMIAEDTHRR